MPRPNERCSIDVIPLMDASEVNVETVDMSVLVKTEVTSVWTS